MTARPPAPTGRRARVADPARRAAYDVVLAVDVDAAFANLLLPRTLRERALAPRDAAFATELCYGTLRWQGVLDDVIAAGSSRPIESLDPPVRAVLRLGAYQLLHLRVPSHAAVHATVDLARAVAGEKVVRFVNAVLRRVAEHDWPAWVDRLAPDDEIGRLAFSTGHPAWIAAAVAQALGDDVGELPAALGEDRPVTHLVARPGRIDREELLRSAGPDAVAGPWSPYAVRLAAGDPASVPAVRDGRAGVQDEGSQLAALMLASAPVDGPDRRWLDMCAGPGGKAALLAGLLPADGWLTAAELQPHRARLVASSLAGTAAAVVVADGTRPPWTPATLDRVLVDAPCTGLGALRRRPEVRWRRTPEDLDRLVPLQERLLAAAVDSARPGGLVGYVTCSPHPRETREVIARVVASRPHLRLVDVRAHLPAMQGLGAGPDVQLWPHRHGTDAMYLALLHRGERGPHAEP